MNVIVSALEGGDVEAWEVLYKEYADFYNMPMTEAILATVSEWIFDENKDFYALIAKDNGGNALCIFDKCFLHYGAAMSAS